MNIDRELLHKAWPTPHFSEGSLRRGYLAGVGVSTVGGWVCTHVDNSLTSWTKSAWGGKPGAVLHLDSDLEDQVHRSFGVSYKEAKVLIGRGDLLPNVEPSDVATWACLLRDLAESVPEEQWDFRFPNTREGETVGFVEWKKIPYQNAYNLRLIKGRGANEDTVLNCKKRLTFDCELDPATALVLARIQLREENA